MNSATGMKVGEVEGGLLLPNGVLRKEAYDRVNNGDYQELLQAANQVNCSRDIIKRLAMRWNPSGNNY
jgi:hypothetical protein